MTAPKEIWIDKADHQDRALGFYIDCKTGGYKTPYYSKEYATSPEYLASLPAEVLEKALELKGCDNCEIERKRKADGISHHEKCIVCKSDI
jgi:hypothetical protein